MKLVRQKWFPWFLLIALGLTMYVAFVTPIGGSFEDVVTLNMNEVADHSPVKARLLRTEFDSAGASYIFARDLYGQTSAIRVDKKLPVAEDEIFVADLSYDRPSKAFELKQLVRVEPMMTFPLIQGLGELGRNMLFHVPMAMVAFIAFLMGTINSVLFLSKKRDRYDVKARAHSAAGLLFTILATVTGSIWARFSWGTFWNWDPRQTSILVLLLIYAAYFVLRSLLEEGEEKKARIAAVYNCIAFVSVPFLMFVLPRITQSLHPGGGGTEAPIINLSGQVHTDRTLLNMHWVAVACYGLLYVWMTDLHARITTLRQAAAEVD